MYSGQDSSTEASELTKFFEYVWADTEGYVYLPTLDRKTDKWKKVFFEWPIHKDHIVKHVLSGSARGLDVYYGPAIFKKGSETPSKQNILGSHVLWSEFDGAAPHFDLNGIEEGTSKPREAAREAHSPVPAPSLRVQSSNDGHEHVYWKLNEFVNSTEWLEDRNRAITYSFRADTSGWDVTQILRPPFTSNYKYKDPLPVTIIDRKKGKYKNELFEPLKPPPRLVTETIVAEELPAVEGIVAKYKWDEEHFKLFMDPQIPEGNRSSALMRLGYFCIETGMTNEEAYAVLFNADERWGKYKGRQDQKRRLVDIIDRARTKHPNPTSELTFRGLHANDEQVEQGRPLVYGFQDFLDSEVKVEWVVEDLLEKGGFGMVASMPGVGKTQFSIQLGMSLALGLEHFLKWKIPTARKVVVFSLEMSHVALKRFMEAIAEAEEYMSDEARQLLQTNFFLVPLGEAIPIERPEALKFVESILDDIQPDGIIIDSVGKLSGGDLSDKSAMMLNERLAHLRSRYNNAFIWLIHHNRKASENNKKPVNLEDVYGNVYLTTDMTSVIILWKTPENDREVEVIPVKSRLAETTRPFTVDRTPNLTFKLRNTDSPEFTNLTKEKEDADGGSSGPDSNGSNTSFFGL